MTTPQRRPLNLADLDLGQARRRAAPVAERVLMNETALNELLNPLRYHASGRGARRADQLAHAYNAFREMTVDQILVSAGIPEGHLANFERDLEQRAEQVNQSFRLLACHAVAELTDPTPPAPPAMMRSGPAHAGPHLGHFGPASAVGIANHTVDEMNRKSGHFWTSVARRIDREEGNNWRMEPRERDYCDEDEDYDDYDDVRY